MVLNTHLPALLGLGGHADTLRPLVSGDDMFCRVFLAQRRRLVRRLERKTGENGGVGKLETVP